MRTTAALLLSMAGCIGLVGCSGTAPAGADQKQTLASEVTAALALLKQTDPSLESVLTSSAGYAVFPEVGKAGLIAGGAYGKGEVFAGGKQPSPIGYAEISAGSVGLQAGAQTFTEVVVFTRPEQLQAFKAGGLSFAADTSAVFLQAGSASAARSGDGVLVFVMPRSGLMLEASVGGQRISFWPMTSLDLRQR